MIDFRSFVVAFAIVMISMRVGAEAPTTSLALGGRTAPQTITVFAAASLKNALDAVTAAYKSKTGVDATISYASSMALAKQIEAGAPAEIFLSADAASIDYLAEKNLIQPKTRFDLLGNALVLIAPRASQLEQVALTTDAFAAAIGSGKIATGNIASVPVGKYAKAALEKLGLWSIAEPHLAFTDNVRSALMFVAREEAPLGIVYLTDAKSEPKVKIVATFPSNAHPPIVYPVALTTSAKGDAPEKFLAFLKSQEAKAIFVGQGFTTLR
ncbi:MAG: molybdate ABC transporter substrate-binding protein [Alphaproteobacteria bacterium]|nr:molybdate ABC transporter substrate-binding protein [Alphaproteobacteria bacterium]